MDLLVRAHDCSKSRFSGTYDLVLARIVVSVHHLKPQELVLFEEVANKKALLKIRVQVVLDLLCATNLDPVCGTAFLIDEAHWIRVALTYPIHVLQVPA